MRRFLYVLFGIAVLYTIGWFVLAGRVQAMIDQQIEAQKADGIEITDSGESKNGFPFALRVKLEKVFIKTPSGSTAAAPVLVMGAGLSDWSHITIAAPDGLLLDFPAGKTRGEIKSSISDATGVITFGSDGIAAIDTTLDAVTLQGLIDGAAPLAAATITLHIDRPDAAPVDHTQQGGHALINASNVILPGAQIPALGNNIKRLTLDAVVMGKLSALNEQALRGWSNEGGTIEIHALSADWGPLGLGLGGTLTLDERLQPLASFTAKISGYASALNALAATHVMKPSTAALASVGLNLLAKPEGADNTPTVSVPITIQDSVVYLSSFKLTRLPEIRLY